MRKRTIIAIAGAAYGGLVLVLSPVQSALEAIKAAPASIAQDTIDYIEERIADEETQPEG